MMQFDTLVQYLIDYRYWAVLVAAFAEGPVVAFITGALVARGFLNPVLTLGLLTLKDVVLDTVFYGMGKYGARLPPIARLVEKKRNETGLASTVLARVNREWEQHPTRLMWVGKLAWGLSAYFLISAGVAGLSLRRFYLYALPVTLAQYGTLMVLGYILGLSMAGIVMQASTSIAILLAACVGVFFLYQLFARAIRKRFEQS